MKVEGRKSRKSKDSVKSPFNMHCHGIKNFNKPKWTNTCSNSTVKTLIQRLRILAWCLLLTLNSYLFIRTNFVGGQQELSDDLDQHTIRYELNQKHIQWKFHPPSSPWMGVCMEAMVKFTKPLKEIVHIIYLHWVESVLTIIRIISGNLFLPKVTRVEKRSSAFSRETLSRRYRVTTLFLRWKLRRIEEIQGGITNLFEICQNLAQNLRKTEEISNMYVLVDLTFTDVMSSKTTVYSRRNTMLTVNKKWTLNMKIRNLYYIILTIRTHIITWTNTLSH